MKISVKVLWALKALLLAVTLILSVALLKAELAYHERPGLEVISH